jgi:hypothetical protein
MRALGNWVARAREAREGAEGLSKGDIEERKRLRAENADPKPPMVAWKHYVETPSDSRT